MPLPDALETVTVRGDWISPLGGGALAGWAQLAAMGTVRSPAGDVVLTTAASRQTLVAGAAEWLEVVLSDSPGLTAPITYRLRVRGENGAYREDRLVQFFTSAVVGGVIRLDDVVSATPAPEIVTYLLASALGQVGGPAGPLDADGLVPAGQLPVAGGSQPLDPDLTAIATITPANGDIIQRVLGAWTNRTMVQLKTDLTLTKGDVGLGDVDNTADADKPLSIATQVALSAVNASAATALGAATAAQASADAKIATGLVDAAGDLLVASAADTVTRLAVGADGQVLTADATAAPGVRWVAPVAAVAIDDELAKLGMVAASGRPEAFYGAGGFDDQIVVALVRVRAGVAFTRLAVAIRTGGAFTPGSGIPNKLGLWSDAGVLLQQTADDDAMWTTATMYSAAVPVPVAAQGADRFVYVGFSIGGYAGVSQCVITEANDGSAAFKTPVGSTQGLCMYAAGGVFANFDPATFGTKTTFRPFVGMIE